MSPQSTACAVPACLDELLVLLRRTRLLDEAQWQRLAAGWPADLAVADAVNRLVEAGLLTAFQAEQVLAGRHRRLRLGPYRLLARMGGGRGLVFQAEHVLMKRLVTLKVLGRTRRRRAAASDDSTAKPAASRRSRSPARHEVTIAAGLSHPNLVAALHAAWLRGRFVLVLEYVEGVDLEQFVAQTGPLPTGLVCEVLRQAAQALAYLHGRGVVHRDVKPANLVLNYVEPGSRPVVKLIDLGLACRVGDRSGELCGTVDYLAPERGAGERVEVRGDLYSLGCTAYELLTGQVPHPGGNWTSKLIRHRMEEPVGLSSLRPDVPPGLARLVARLMARDPNARFTDPRALLAALDELFPPVPLALPVTAASVPAPRRRRRQWKLPLVLLTLAALAGVMIGGLARTTVGVPASTLGRTALQSRPVAADGSGEPSYGGTPAFITVSGRDEVFTDLEKAIRAAGAEAVLVLHGRGPHRLRPIAWRGRSLTLRGAGKEVPRIERIDAEGLDWDALLSGEGDVVLDRLELSGGSSADRVAPVVMVSGGALKMRNCRVEGRTAGPLLALRRGRSLRLMYCEIDAQAQGIAIEQATGRGVDVTLQDSRLRVRDVTGAALLVWAGEAAPATAGTIALRRCRFEAGRTLACRALGGKLHVQTEQCRFVFHQALLSLDACPERHDWPSQVSWAERGNEYRAGTAWVRLDGQPTVWNESGWRRR
jgi:hypothetical protein